MKKLFTAIFICYYFVASTQEISELKRVISFGEKQGYKIILPNRKVSDVVNMTNKFLKNQDAESLKSPKGSNELIYKKVFLKNSMEPNILCALIEQEGNQVAWLGFFFKEKDSVLLDSSHKAAIHIFLNSIYKKSMFDLYEDSISRQSKALSQAENKVRDLSKQANQNDKNINKSKKEISFAEGDISKSETKISTLTSQLSTLELAVKDAETKLKDAQSEMEKTKQLEIALKDLIRKDKEMNKRLSELEKDAVSNANLITAQNQDISKNAEAIRLQQEQFIAAERLAKTNLKDAEKNLNKAKEDLKDAEKTIKSEKKAVEKSQERISKNKKTIDDSTSKLSSIQNQERNVADEEVKKEREKLEKLKETQKQYI